MAGTTRQRRGNWAFAIVGGALLAAASSVAWAEACKPGIALPVAAPAADDGEKFQLITRLCPVLAVPALVQHAAQLALYDSATSPVIRLDAAATPVSRGATVPLPEAATVAPRKAGVVAGPAAARILSIAPEMIAAARANDVDPLLLHAVAHVESRHNTRAVSPAGARGVLQLMPGTAQRFGVEDPARGLFDAATNLRAGAAYLRVLQDRYGQDLRLVLAAYNAGEGAVARYGNTVPPFPETQAYVRDVLAMHRRLTSAFKVTPAGTLVARGELQ